MNLAMLAFELRAIAETSATGMVDCLILGTLVAVLAGLLLRVARRQDAGIRFSLCFASLIAIATLPFIGAIWKAHRAESTVAATTSHVAVTLPGSWAIYLFGLWAVLAVIALGRVAMGLRHLRRIRRTCVPVALEKLDAQVRETLTRKQPMRRVALCTSDEVQVPTAIGLFRPAVIIPEWALEDLSADQLNHILIHELAHLRRWDDWTNLLQQIIKSLFFFHPAVWWIERRVSLEREMACDDAVVAETASPRAYAECLAHLAERSFMGRSIALTQAVLGRVHQISRRVAQILDQDRRVRTGKAWTVAVPLVGLLAGAGFVAISNAPELVAFRDPSAPGVRHLNNVPLADSGIAAFSAPVVPAKFVAPSSASRIDRKKTARARPHRVVAQPQQSFMAQNTPAQNREPGMIHLASVKPEQVVSAETIVIVVERSNTLNQPAYQLRVLQVLLWHPPVNEADNKVSPKI